MAGIVELLTEIASAIDEGDLVDMISSLEYEEIVNLVSEANDIIDTTVGDFEIIEDNQKQDPETKSLPLTNIVAQGNDFEIIKDIAKQDETKVLPLTVVEDLPDSRDFIKSVYGFCISDVRKYYFLGKFNQNAEISYKDSGHNFSASSMAASAALFRRDNFEKVMTDLYENSTDNFVYAHIGSSILKFHLKMIKAFLKNWDRKQWSVSGLKIDDYWNDYHIVELTLAIKNY